MNQSSRGPGVHPQDQFGAAAPGCGHASTRAWAPAGSPSGSTSPSAQGRRAEPGEEIRGAAAEHRFDGDAAGDGHVAAYARARAARRPAPRRRAPVRARPRARAARRRVTAQGAPATATVTAERGRTAQPVRVVSRTAASGGLPTSRLASAARGRVQRAGARHAEVGVAGAAQVLHGGQGPGPDDGEGPVASCGDRHRTNRTRVPGASSAAGHARVVPQHRVRRADQLPAARARRAGTRPVYGPGERHRPGRHRGTRESPGAARAAVGQPGQVAEARARTRRRRRGTRPPRGCCGTSSAATPHRAATSARSGPSYRTGISTALRARGTAIRNGTSKLRRRG